MSTSWWKDEVTIQKKTKAAGARAMTTASVKPMSRAIRPAVSGRRRGAVVATTSVLLDPGADPGEHQRHSEHQDGQQHQQRRTVAEVQVLQPLLERVQVQGLRAVAGAPVGDYLDAVEGLDG